MANHEYKILSEDAIKYLCGLIRDLASVSEGIDNINLADDKTFSNIYIKNLIDKCLEDANAEAEKLVGALTHLTCKETAIQPTLDNSEINVIYLYSADGNSPYQQFLKISEDKLVDLGSTSISLEDYIKAADIAKDYATKAELKAVTDKIGTTALTTTDTTITGAIEEVKGIADDKAEILDSEKNDVNTWSSNKIASEITEVGTELNAKLNELENITRLTDFDEAIPEKGKNKIYYVNKLIGTYKCAQWRVESMYYDVSELKQYRGVQKATAINGVDNIMLMREYYLGDDNVIHWGDWVELATTDSTLKTIQLSGSVDCNTLTEPGLYTASSGAVTSITNTPANIGSTMQLDGGFSVLVTKTNVDSVYYGMQMFIQYGSDLPFMRKSYYLNGQYWTPWQELATMDKVNALHKETVGYITGSLLGSVVKNANLYYQKFGDTRLVINGWVSIDAVSAGTPIFTLPNNWKANSNYLLPCYVENSNVACACLINIAEGTVSSYTPLPATLELRFCAEIYLQ